MHCQHSTQDCKKNGVFRKVQAGGFYRLFLVKAGFCKKTQVYGFLVIRISTAR